jgi:hypothetical protein
MDGRLRVSRRGGGEPMIILDTTKDELRAKWKKMYRKRKQVAAAGGYGSGTNYGYFTGKMEYTAWLLIHSREVDTESEER